MEKSKPVSSSPPPLKHSEVVRRIGQVRLELQSKLKTVDGKNKWGIVASCFPSKARRARYEAKRELVERAVQLSDAEIARFLRAHEYDPKLACDQVVQTLLWRRDHGVDTILGKSAEFVAQDKRKTIYWGGEDLHGRPILTVCVARHDPHLFSAETTVRFVLWKLEQKLVDPGVEEITLLIDLKGSSRHNYDRDLLKLLIPTLKQFYPGRLGLGLVYPMSTVHWLAWKFWASTLSDETVKKFVFIDDISGHDAWSSFHNLLQGFVHRKTPGHSQHDQEHEGDFGGVDLSVEKDPKQENFPSSSRFQDFISLDNLEKRYGGGKEEEDWEEGLNFDELIESFDEDKAEFSKFLDAQDERLESLMRIAESRSGRVSSVSSSDVSVEVGTVSSQVKRVFGESTRQVSLDAALKDGSIINAWSPVDASCFKVRRGPDYKKHKKKAPSEQALYELITMDLVETEAKEFHIANKVQLPGIPPSEVENKSGLPEVLIVSYQAPLYEPPNPMFSKSKTDGKTVGMSALFRLSDWARENSEDVAVQMFHRFVNCFEADPYRERLKCIASIVNPEAMNLSRVEKALHTRYDSTPWLVRPQYKFFHGPGYFEIDIDIHTFAYFSRKVGWSVIKRLDNAVLDACLVIQSETDEEMPERVLCCWRANRLQLNNAPKLSPPHLCST